MHRASENFGFVERGLFRSLHFYLQTMSVMILNRLRSRCMAGSVGFEALLSGSRISMLLSFMILHIENEGAFDILVLAIIIQAG